MLIQCPCARTTTQKHSLSFVMWLEWICMQNNEMDFTWRDNGLGKYISFSVICPCYHERQWNFHVRNATSNHTVDYAQKMVIRKPEKNFLWLQEKTKTVFREQSLLISKMCSIIFILLVPIDTVLWHICVMNYKSALQQATAFCESCISNTHTTSTGPFNM